MLASSASSSALSSLTPRLLDDDTDIIPERDRVVPRDPTLRVIWAVSVYNKTLHGVLCANVAQLEFGAQLAASLAQLTLPSVDAASDFRALLACVAQTSRNLAALFECINSELVARCREKSSSLERERDETLDRLLERMLEQREPLIRRQCELTARLQCAENDSAFVLDALERKLNSPRSHISLRMVLPVGQAWMAELRAELALAREHQRQLDDAYYDDALRTRERKVKLERKALRQRDRHLKFFAALGAQVTQHIEDLLDVLHVNFSLPLLLRTKNNEAENIT